MLFSFFMIDFLVEVLFILNVFVRFFLSNLFYNFLLKYVLEIFFCVIEGRSLFFEVI